MKASFPSAVSRAANVSLIFIHQQEVQQVAYTQGSRVITAQNYYEMTILITGASGRTSGYVIKTLLATPSPPPLRLFVRSDSAAQTLLAAHAGLGPTNFARGDLLEASTLPPAVAGVDVVFHNAPAFHPNETAMGIALIDAAKAARVKHFVYCSVLHPVLTKLLNHKAKREYVVVVSFRSACEVVLMRVPALKNT